MTNFNALSTVNIVPLSRAALCVNCEHISDGHGDQCPLCGSFGLISLARVLGTANAPQVVSGFDLQVGVA